MPTATIGGVSLVLYGMISAVGVRNVVENRVDFTKSRNVIIAALILVLAIGVTYSGEGRHTHRRPSASPASPPPPSSHSPQRHPPRQGLRVRLRPPGRHQRKLQGLRAGRNACGHFVPREAPPRRRRDGDRRSAARTQARQSADWRALAHSAAREEFFSEAEPRKKAGNSAEFPAIWIGCEFVSPLRR